ncbi:MAG: hypothetical protein MK165_01220 [Pirellulaceae bacterium]|nr:hypothetical protein [Pirellulaceae bacterium]
MEWEQSRIPQRRFSGTSDGFLAGVHRIDANLSGQYLVICDRPQMLHLLSVNAAKLLNPGVLILVHTTFSPIEIQK